MLYKITPRDVKEICHVLSPTIDAAMTMYADDIAELMVHEMDGCWGTG